MGDYKLDLLPHQNKLLSAIQLFKKVSTFFLVAGYGAGKSFSIDILIKWIAVNYQGHHITGGIGSESITLLRKTVVQEFIKIAKTYNIAYHEDKQKNILTLGTVSFVMIAQEKPQEIFAYNFSFFISDELDELPEEKGKLCVQALYERARVPLPDRPPFLVFCSTSQGQKTLYKITLELKEKGLSYILIRGSTKDNPYNDSSYVERLYNLYDDKERLVYLEGYFLNLSTGRVYSKYDPDCNDLSDDEYKTLLDNYKDDKLILVGQDLNNFYNKTIIIKKRDNLLFVDNVLSIEDIGSVPSFLRNSYPDCDIVFFPDVAGQSREVLKGYKKEFNDNAIQLRMGNINPRISERIFLVNKLFEKSQLFLTKRANKLSMALKSRGFNNAGQPEKSSSSESADHYCDSLEYVIYKIVYSYPEFKNFIVKRGNE